MFCWWLPIATGFGLNPKYILKTLHRRAPNLKHWPRSKIKDDVPRQGLLFKGSGEFLFILWYSVPDAEIWKHVGASSYYNCSSAIWELNAYNMPRSVSDLALLSSCNGWSRQHSFAEQKNFILKHEGLRCRIRRLPASKTCANAFRNSANNIPAERRHLVWFFN